jgi:hypothetical protein
MSQTSKGTSTMQASAADLAQYFTYLPEFFLQFLQNIRSGAQLLIRNRSEWRLGCLANVVEVPGGFVEE